MKKYGLQLRVQPQQKKPNPTKPVLPTPLGFYDDDEDDVERDISRQASKNKSIKDLEEQHKKALEEDPSVFDYDGVYDEMKEKEVRPRAQDRQERKPKYIQNLMEKVKVREREHEIVYERKLAKERSQEDHLYADKDKFLTSAYKKKLAEQAKWMEEEHLRQLREEKDDVTKKSDMTDFYFHLSKNVAFGADNSMKSKKQVAKETTDASEEGSSLRRIASNLPPVKERDQGEASTSLKESFVHKYAKPVVDATNSFEEKADAKPVIDAPNTLEEKVDSKPVIDAPNTLEEKAAACAEVPPTHEPKRDHHKRGGDQVAAAKERFLARKRAKEQWVNQQVK